MPQGKNTDQPSAPDAISSEDKVKQLDQAVTKVQKAEDAAYDARSKFRLAATSEYYL